SPHHPSCRGLWRRSRQCAREKARASPEVRGGRFAASTDFRFLCERSRLGFEAKIKIPARGWEFLMRLLLHATRCAAALLLVHGTFAFALARDKSVWSYEGGLFVITNGSLPNGPCFRLTGRVTSGDFFNRLKRLDKESGTIFRLG